MCETCDFNLWVRRSCDVFALLVGLGTLAACIALGILSIGNISADIPASQLIAAGKSLTAAGCRCDVEDEIPLNAFVSFDTDLAEAYCNTQVPANVLKNNPLGYLYANVSGIPCITSEYQLWHDIFSNATLPSLSVQSPSQIKQLTANSVQKSNFMIWNIETDVLLLIRESLRSLVKSGAISKNLYNITTGDRTITDIWDAWTNDEQSIQDIINVIFGVLKIDYQQYLRACKPMGCTELKTNTNFFGIFTAAAVFPNWLYMGIKKIKDALVLWLDKRRKQRIKKLVVDNHNAKNGQQLSALDYKFLNEVSPYLLTQLEMYKQEQVSKFGGTVKDVQLTVGIMDELESRGAEMLEHQQSVIHPLSSPDGLQSPSRGVKSPHGRVSVQVRQNSSLGQDLAIGLGRVASWVTTPKPKQTIAPSTIALSEVKTNV